MSTALKLSDSCDEPRFEQTTCPACNGAGYHMWGDALAVYADPCTCEDGKIKRQGIPLTLDLRAAYRPITRTMETP